MLRLDQPRYPTVFTKLKTNPRTANSVTFNSAESPNSKHEAHTNRFFWRRVLLDDDSFDKLEKPLGILIRSDGRDLGARAVFDGFGSLRRAFLHAVVR